MTAAVDFLVTGGAGFIGSNIVRWLVREGRSVRVLDNLSTGRAHNLDPVRACIDFVQGDIRDLASVRAAAAGCRNVLHLAAFPSVAESVQDPATFDAVNTGGTLNVLIAARDAGARRLVFSSSCSVYGDGPESPKREDLPPAPLSPYAVQKLTGEHYCRVFRRLYGLEAFCLRYFNVFGPGQNPRSQYAAVIPNFVSALQRGAPMTIHGDGGQTRDFVFVEDVVRANLSCCEAPAAAAGEVYNVACGTSISINDLANTLMKVMGRQVTPVHDAAMPGEVRDSRGDGSRAARMLGWKPITGLEEGLRRTAEAFLAEAAG